MLSLIGVATFTRIFQPQEYGKYSLALAIIGPLGIIITQWIALPIERFFQEFQKRNASTVFFEIIRLMIYTVIIFILLFALIVWLGLHVIMDVFPHSLMFTGAVAVILLQSITSLLLPLLRASFQVNSYRLSMVLTSILSITITLSLIYLIGKNVAWLLWGQAFALVLVLPYLVFKSNILQPQGKSIKHKIGRRHLVTIRRFLQYGLPLMIWFLAIGLLNESDKYIIQLFYDADKVAIYSVNYNLIAGLAIFLNTPVNMAAGPILYQQWAKKAMVDLGITMWKMTELYIILALALVGGTLVVGKMFALIILGPNFHEGATVLLPIVVGIALKGSANIGRKSLEMHECTSILAKYALLAVSLNIILNLAFVPIYGYLAAAYTTLSCYAIYTALIWRKSFALIPWRNDMSHVGKYLLYMVAAQLLAKFVIHLLNDTNTSVMFVFGGISFATTYFILLFIFSRTRITYLLNQ
jgi:O-antigen/teichoic acid export membrane protein